MSLRRLITTAGFFLCRFTGSHLRHRCSRFLSLAQFWPGLLALFVLAATSSAFWLGSLPTAESSPLLPGDLPQIDSFSGPDVAVAVLSRQVDDLYFAYILTNAARGPDDEPSAAVASKSGRVPVASAGREFSIRQSDDGPGGIRESLWSLNGRLRGLRSGLLHDLLSVQYQNRLWNDFTSTYLELLAIEPDTVATACWARSALVCSGLCGRTAEVVDALQHITRFSKKPRTIARLQAALGDWRAVTMHESTASDLQPPKRP